MERRNFLKSATLLTGLSVVPGVVTASMTDLQQMDKKFL